ncbi:MAG TPA: hypothetical protein VLI92_00190 [Candidatus Saccharimonadales bacterium]|nr:hypothetical protein [Candidatus Saccharimonadales bacterium]
MPQSDVIEPGDTVQLTDIGIFRHTYQESTFLDRGLENGSEGKVIETYDTGYASVTFLKPFLDRANTIDVRLEFLVIVKKNGKRRRRQFRAKPREQQR